MFESVLPLQPCDIDPGRTPWSGAHWWGVWIFLCQSTFRVSVKIFILVFVLYLHETWNNQGRTMQPYLFWYPHCIKRRNIRSVIGWVLVLSVLLFTGKKIGSIQIWVRSNFSKRRTKFAWTWVQEKVRLKEVLFLIQVKKFDMVNECTVW